MVSLAKIAKGEAVPTADVWTQARSLSLGILLHISLFIVCPCQWNTISMRAEILSSLFITVSPNHGTKTLLNKYLLSKWMKNYSLLIEE